MRRRFCAICRATRGSAASIIASRNRPSARARSNAARRERNEKNETRTRESAIIIAKPGPIDELLQGAYSCHPR